MRNSIITIVRVAPWRERLEVFGKGEIGNLDFWLCVSRARERRVGLEV